MLLCVIICCLTAFCILAAVTSAVCVLVASKKPKPSIRAMSESLNAAKAAFYPHDADGPTTTAEERAAAGNNVHNIEH